MAKLVLVTTHPMTARLLMRGQLRHLCNSGFDVVLVSSPGPDLDEVARRENVRVIPIPMARAISPLRDCVSLYRLVRVLRAARPEIVSAGTPKAALLAMLAAWLLRVPVRVYVLRGLRLETLTGMQRWVASASERITVACAHEVVAVSPSLAARLLSLGIGEGKVVVLGPGSSNGVDLRRFSGPAKSTIATPPRRTDVDAGGVIGFVGRFTRDKGLSDLLAAYDEVVCARPGARLLLLGEHDESDPLPHRLLARIASDSRIDAPGFVDPVAFYAGMDVLCFPSYRDGLPNVPLEAAAAGVPAVGYAVTGTIDAVQHGETGTLVPAGDHHALAAALRMYLDEPETRRRHGAAARARVERLFAQEMVWERWVAEYRRLLEAHLRSAIYRRAGKRCLDVTVALLGLLVGWPVLAVVAGLVRWQLGAPVLFAQQRPGMGGRPFTLYKFRTMSHAVSSDGTSLADGARLGTFGRLLRRTSLDELPQLLNVLRGDMSLVGPRPLLMRYLDRFTPHQARRHDVRPGITGWAQVNGRNARSWDQRLDLDVWYVDSISLALDLRILTATVMKVLGATDVTQEGQATVEEFRGAGH